MGSLFWQQQEFDDTVIYANMENQKSALWTHPDRAGFGNPVKRQMITTLILA